MPRRLLSKISHFNPLSFQTNSNFNLTSSSIRALSVGLVGEDDDPLYADVPRPPRTKSERKPYPTPMKVLIRRAKEEREARKAQPCRMLEYPPDNGLLVPELVDMARRVHRARESLLIGLSKLVNVIPIQRCRYCSEVHIGHTGHEIRTCTGPKSGLRRATHVWRKGGVQDVIHFPKCFHLYDRVGKPRITHNEKHTIRCIPAIVELCIQAGLDLEKYPTKRRTKPVYSIEGRIVDFDKINNEKNINSNSQESKLDDYVLASNRMFCASDSDHDEIECVTKLCMRAMDLWFEMISGAMEMMGKYRVWTCGYCAAVQVGPKGHKVRMCRASKHQSRDGLHAWQEATVDDLVGPNYVWHVRDLLGPPLANRLKRYYGKAPAVVELCVQGGAPVPDQYRSMMRLDVVPPACDEVDLVA